MGETYSSYGIEWPTEPMTEEERLRTYFTTDIEQAMSAYPSVSYGKEDFEKRFGNMDTLSDSEKEKVYEVIFNEIRASGMPRCQYVAEGAGVFLDAAYEMSCEDMEEINPMEKYEGVSCYCIYQSASDETFYVKAFPPPSIKCLLGEQSWDECYGRPPYQYQPGKTELSLGPPKFWKWRSLWTKSAIDRIDDSRHSHGHQH